jgi:serine/threonine protein kinase
LFRVPNLLERAKPLVPYDYLAPERIRGHRTEEASDIYALGVLLHELLTGQTPYARDDTDTTRLRNLHSPLPHLGDGLELFEPLIHGCIGRWVAPYR